jgi:hypothetical protein
MHAPPFAPPPKPLGKLAGLFAGLLAGGGGDTAAAVNATDTDAGAACDKELTANKGAYEG